MSTKDLYALAQENGMTDEEFVKEVSAHMLLSRNCWRLINILYRYHCNSVTQIANFVR